MTAPLSFDLTRKTLEVTIDNEEYELVEFDGVERDKYLNSVGKRLKTEVGGGQTVKNFDGLQAELVSASLFKIDKVSRARIAVPVKTIQSWPARVSATLFEEARKLSGLGDDDDDEDEEREAD